MNDQLINPNAVPGSNQAPDYAKQVTDRMAQEYAELARSVSDILSRAREMPLDVTTQDEASVVSGLVVDMRALSKRIDGIRESEKEPHLTAGRAIDGFFFGLVERLERRKATDKAGGADVLYARIHAYNVKRQQEEQRVRDEAARVAREEQARLAKEKQKAEQAQREAEAAERRARSEASAEERRKAAADAAAESARLAAAEEAARQVTRDAAAAAAAKPADMVRERHDSGAMNTMRTVGYVEIDDRMKLDKEALWPFLDEKALHKALMAWAKITQFKKAMPGAWVGLKDDTVIL